MLYRTILIFVVSNFVHACTSVSCCDAVPILSLSEAVFAGRHAGRILYSTEYEHPGGLHGWNQATTPIPLERPGSVSSKLFAHRRPMEFVMKSNRPKIHSICAWIAEKLSQVSFVCRLSNGSPPLLQSSNSSMVDFAARERGQMELYAVTST